MQNKKENKNLIEIGGEAIPEEIIESKIIFLRGKKVILDKDLAFLYSVPNKRLNEQVKRNSKRFPEDFMFQLNNQEFKILKSQFATSSWGGIRKLPYAFTEHGILMLSSVLNSNRAIQINIQIMRIFVRIRQILTNFCHPEFAGGGEGSLQQSLRGLIKIFHANIFEAIPHLASEIRNDKKPRQPAFNAGVFN